MMEQILFIGVWLLLLNAGLCENNVTKRLPNEECRLRETLVHVDKLGSKFYPLIVKLHRCGGACRHYPPSVKGCVSSTPSKYISVKVTRLNDFKEDTVYLRNDTSCSCRCVRDEKACSPKTQIFDDRSCKCKCKPEYRSISWRCMYPFEWDPVTCSCGCNLRCGHREQLDRKKCRCNCKTEAYMKCAAMNKYLNPSTCTCMFNAEKEKSVGNIPTCKGLPRKWIVAFAVSGVVMLMILIFDCVLYQQKTGSLYRITHCCKKYKQKTEERDICLPKRAPEEG